MTERYMKRLRWVLMLAVIGTAMSGLGQEAVKKEAGSSSAQAPDERTFTVSFVARELDENGKVVNSRRYDTMVGLRSGRGQIRTGAKIPVLTGVPQNKSDSAPLTYLDVGVNFDVINPRIVEGNRLAMTVNAEVSSLDPATVNAENKPTIRQNRWSGDVGIPIGGHKVIFSSDDLASKRTMQVEVTVAQVN